METPEVAHFRRCVLEGDWSEAEASLSSLGVVDEEDFRVGIVSTSAVVVKY